MLGGMSRVLVLSLIFVASTFARAEDDAFTEYPSPNARFAFRTTRTDDAHKAELIETASGKVVQIVAQADEGRFSTSALWKRDSTRFALMVSDSRLSSSVEVFVRDGAKFRKVPLPEVAEPKIPAKYEGSEKRVWHWSAIDYRQPVRWRKDGSLVVECETTTDGNGSYVTAMRTVIYGFGKTGKANILSNENKVTTHFEK